MTLPATLAMDNHQYVAAAPANGQMSIPER